ncbi:MAG: hypothetical protein ACE5EM_04385 [Sphingomonadales bacterium]
MATTKSQTADAIGKCLNYILDDAVKAGMPLVALHIRLAITEAEEVISLEASKKPTRIGRKRKAPERADVAPMKPTASGRPEQQE